MMKVNLVGRPGKVVQQGSTIVTVMESRKVPALPDDLPAPPKAPVKYTVYIDERQWLEKAEPSAGSAGHDPRRRGPEGPLAQAADHLDLEAYDRKVLKDFLRRDGSLKEIPAQYKKQQVVLRHLVKAFEPERQYTEKQVNDSLARFHPDTASLRRAMIDAKSMSLHTNSESSSARGQHGSGNGGRGVRSRRLPRKHTLGLCRTADITPVAPRIGEEYTLGYIVCFADRWMYLVCRFE